MKWRVWWVWAGLVGTTAAGCAAAAATQPAATAHARFAPQDLFVSPDGDDRWTGSPDSPNPSRTDGPVRTIERARDLLRQRKQQGGNHALPTTVWFRAGRYPVEHTLQFTHDDSDATFAAYPGEHPVWDAGRPIPRWREGQANGHPAWVADVPPDWDVRELVVDGKRATRPRLPKLTGGGATSVFRMEHADNVPTAPDGSTRPDTFKGADAFVAKPGDFRPWHNLRDVEVVVLHFWIEERMPVESYDPNTRRVVSTRKTQMSLADDHTGQWARYYLDNVFEALSDPGQFYYDRPAHTLYYLPRPGEVMNQTPAEAGGVDQLLKVTGADNVAFRGITFTGTGWHHPSESLPPSADPAKKPPAGMTQTAATLPAALEFTASRNCRVRDCRIVNVGQYAVELGPGCVGNRLAGNDIGPCGGGGVKIGGAAAGGPADKMTGDNRVTDNRIRHVGRVFHSAAGILVQNAYSTRIAHNDVFDGYQMAVAVGWSWGYGPNVSRDNHIEFNHIHRFGQGWLSDIGGVYTLGVQPGTTVRNNHVHNITAATYGGWGIYPDEGSSQLLIENNVVHDTSHQAFHQHYGRDNVVRNNVFAFGQQGQVEISRKEDHNSLTLQHNLLVSDDAPIYAHGVDAGRNFVSDHNLLFDVSGKPLRPTAKKSWPAWQKGGHDQHSIVADPLFVDAAKRDLRLRDNSPALTIGFRPIDLSQVGPRPADRRQ
jgi:hypothetical protein